MPQASLAISFILALMILVTLYFLLFCPLRKRRQER